MSPTYAEWEHTDVTPHATRRAAALEALQPYIDRARTFSGWDFAGIVDVRPLEPEPPWDYAALAREHVARSKRVLDIGTGGGEVFERIIPDATARAVATERWDVNARVATDRLRAYGVDVVHARSRDLPFREGAFDLVVDRHEGVDPAEVIRVLGGSGVFVTQQVWKRHWQELRAFFPRKTDWGDHLTAYAEAFRSAGYDVDIREHDWKLAYATLGDVVFMLLVTPWEVPDFNPEREIDTLLALEDSLSTPAGLVLTASSYLLTARRPA